MVPPIYPGQEVPLSRVGLQQTYVSYKDGVETFVIRPGFTGKVDEFGMLIPFPTPPAIRKVPLCGALSADELSYYEKTLAEKNIKTDSDGLNEYLSGLHPNEQQQQRAMQLIEALGTTDSFAKREDAMAKLLVLPILPNEELIAAASGNDPEIRWRARTILKLGKPESDRVLYAAFKTIDENTLAGVAAELIRAIPLCDKKIVWEFSEPGAVDAFRLANGNTLITGNTRFIEVAPDKSVVWTQIGCRYGTARR